MRIKETVEVKNLGLIACSTVLLAGACASDPATIEVTPAQTIAPVVTATPTTATPDATVPPASTAATVPATDAPGLTASFDYTSLGDLAGMTTTPLGLISWLTSGSVPQQWLDRGFPHPDAVASRIDAAAFGVKDMSAVESAPCCLTVIPAGDGLIGFGATDWADDNTTPYPTDWIEAESHGLGCGDTPWRGRIDEVWFSDGSTEWTQASGTAFGEHTLSACSGEMHVVHHDGRWLAVAPSGLEGKPDPPEESAAVPFLAFTSTDLEVWERLDIELNREGMQIEITSVAAHDAGWAMFGTFISLEPTKRSETGIPLGPRSVEWAGWTSNDGQTFSPLDLTELLGGPPWCEPVEAHSCAAIFGHFTDDAVVAYVHQYGDHDDHLTSGWRLWIGLIEE
jgi:hypothetical protein